MAEPVTDLLGALAASIETARAERLAHGTAADPHVVSPKARGWTRCTNCFGAVFVCLQETGCDGTSHDIRCNNQCYGHDGDAVTGRRHWTTETGGERCGYSDPRGLAVCFDDGICSACGRDTRAESEHR